MLRRLNLILLSHCCREACASSYQVAFSFKSGHKWNCKHTLQGRQSSLEVQARRVCKCDRNEAAVGDWFLLRAWQMLTDWESDYSELWWRTAACVSQFLGQLDHSQSELHRSHTHIPARRATLLRWAKVAVLMKEGHQWPQEQHTWLLSTDTVGLSSSVSLGILFSWRVFPHALSALTCSNWIHPPSCIERMLVLNNICCLMCPIKLSSCCISAVIQIFLFLLWDKLVFPLQILPACDNVQHLNKIRTIIKQKCIIACPGSIQRQLISWALHVSTAAIALNSIKFNSLMMPVDGSRQWTVNKIMWVRNVIWSKNVIFRIESMTPVRFMSYLIY